MPLPHRIYRDVVETRGCSGGPSLSMTPNSDGEDRKLSDLSSQSTRLLSDPAGVLIRSHSRINVSSTCEEWAFGGIVGQDL
jgi:hypothetical protein